VQPTDADRQLYDRARSASAAAYAPYSGYAVGAVLLTADGTVITGVNVENASYGLTCCAERNAVFAAVAAGHRAFEAVAVHAQAGAASPCGACLQVLAEFGELRVIWRRDAELAAAPLSELLPERFRL